ncbi:DinB family protein [Streptomyces sp. NPDC089919]|uniref:mycothiol transferase n=1 Tax=Streptomyces sp. NPDC089919 TaxID=3155188 RepID=UPI00343AEE9B
MKATEVLADGFGRIREEVHAVLEGLDAETLAARPDPGANSVAWLVWHLARIQDVQVAGPAGRTEVWHEEGWAGRFGLDLPAGSDGYGHTPEEAGKVLVEDGALLRDYYDAVHARSLEYLHGLTAADLGRVVDERWDPPVTLGVRLVSILADDLQHVGQAAYLRGLLERR